MKNLKIPPQSVLSTTLVTLLLLMSFGCQDDASNDLANPDENKSVISLVEEKNAVTLFKRDLTMTAAKTK